MGLLKRAFLALKLAIIALPHTGHQLLRNRSLAFLHAATPPLPPADADQAAAAQAAGKKRSKVEELMQQDLEAKKRRQDGGGGGGGAAGGRGGGGPEPASSSGRGRLDHWLTEGVVVKVMSKALKEHGYYKQKVRSGPAVCAHWDQVRRKGAGAGEGSALTVCAQREDHTGTGSASFRKRVIPCMRQAHAATSTRTPPPPAPPYSSCMPCKIAATPSRPTSRFPLPLTKPQGVIERVIAQAVGEVSMLDSDDVIRVDQAELETVIPSAGGRVRVVNGAHRGNRGELLEIDTSRFAALVRLAKAPAEGRTVWFEYEDICKAA